MSLGNTSGWLVDLFLLIDMRVFSDCKERLSSIASRDEQSAERLWKLSEEMTHLNDVLKEINNHSH